MSLKSTSTWIIKGNPKMVKTELGKTIYERLQHPEEWEISKYTVTHKSGVSLWVNNGFFCFGIHTPTKFSFSFIEKVLLYFATRKMIERNITATMNTKWHHQQSR